MHSRNQVQLENGREAEALGTLALYSARYVCACYTLLELRHEWRSTSCLRPTGQITRCERARERDLALTPHQLENRRFDSLSLRESDLRALESLSKASSQTIQLRVQWKPPTRLMRGRSTLCGNHRRFCRPGSPRIRCHASASYQAMNVDRTTRSAICICYRFADEVKHCHD